MKSKVCYRQQTHSQSLLNAFKTGPAFACHRAFALVTASFWEALHTFTFNKYLLNTVCVPFPN